MNYPPILRKNYKIQPVSEVDYIDLDSGIFYEHLDFKRMLLRLARRLLTWRVISTLAVVFTASFLLWKTVIIIESVITPIQQSLAAPNIDDISISNFQAQFHPRAAKVFLTLSTNGKTTKYPTLLIDWAGSGTQIIRVDASEYPHPDAPFKGSFDVEFEIYKPANSTAMNLSIQYD